MRFRILGPVEVDTGSGTIPIGGERERFVLSLLLLSPDGVTPADRIIDSLWERPPATGRQQVHNILARLRRRLREADPSLIVTNAAGYELRRRGHSFDVDDFRELASRGDAAIERGESAAACAAYEQALALWRGSPLADVPVELTHETRQQLGQERLAVVGRLAEARYRLGRYDDVLTLVDGQLGEEPFHERLHDVRLRALAAAGRRREALDAFRAVRKLFVDELGVEPGASLTLVHQRILDGLDPDPPEKAPPPRQLPPETLDLVGRDDLLRQLVDALGEAGSTPALQVLVGPGGVGKTAVAVAVARRMADRFPDGTLYADLTGAANGADAHELQAGFLRSLGIAQHGIPDTPTERTALYRTLLAGRRVLVVLDDAYDEAQVRSLLPSGPGCAALVTARRRLVGLVGAGRQAIEPLRPDDAVALLGLVAGLEPTHDDPASLAAVARACGYLPLAVCVAGARLAADPHLDAAALRVRLEDKHARLGELTAGDLDVRASIAASYDCLSPRAASALRAIGLVAGSGRWPEWLVAQVLELPEADVRRTLHELVDVHLVQPLGLDSTSQTRYRLHDLVADFAHVEAEATDSPDLRGLLVDRALDGWLGVALAADRGLAHGWYAADGLSGGVAHPRTAQIAADDPMGWFAEEIDNLERAVSLALTMRREDSAALVAVAMAGFLAIRNDVGTGRVLRRVLDGLGESESAEVRFRLLNGLFQMSGRLNHAPGLSKLAADELAAAQAWGDPRAVYEAFRHAGAAAYNSDLLCEAVRWFDRAALQAARLGDSHLERRAAAMLGIAYVAVGQPERARPLLAAMAADESVDAWSRERGRWQFEYARCLIALGAADEALPLVVDSHKLADAGGDQEAASMCEWLEGVAHLRAGRPELARCHHDNALAMVDGRADPDRHTPLWRLRVDIAIGERRWSEARAALDRMVSTWRADTGAHTYDLACDTARLARVHDGLCDPERARAFREESESLLHRLDLPQRCLLAPGA